ncbi:hypothetical protein DFJ73DRAFT_279747 [Zopfochytrium polystomum]|nr:hypothetical protein DFJ73DRAFT_279747 [Zopfochytrium polystomum]
MASCSDKDNPSPRLAPIFTKRHSATSLRDLQSLPDAPKAESLASDKRTTSGRALRSTLKDAHRPAECGRSSGRSTRPREFGRSGKLERAVEKPNGPASNADENSRGPDNSQEVLEAIDQNARPVDPSWSGLPTSAKAVVGETSSDASQQTQTVSLLKMNPFFLTKEQRNLRKQLDDQEKLKKEMEESSKLSNDFFSGRSINPFLQPRRHTVKSVCPADDDGGRSPASAVAQTALTPFPSYTHVGRPESVGGYTQWDCPRNPFKLKGRSRRDEIEKPPERISLMGQSYPNRTVSGSKDAIGQIFTSMALDCGSPPCELIRGPHGEMFLLASKSAVRNHFATTFGDAALHPFFNRLSMSVTDGRFDASRSDSAPRSWLDEFTPSVSAEILGDGNKDSITSLRTWLQTWRPRTTLKSSAYQVKKKSSTKRRKLALSDEDFIVDDDEGSDFDWDGESPEREPPRHVRLVGPPGSCRTTAVMAVAAECGYDVIEINSGQGRSGKEMDQTLAEATQSHSIHKRAFSSEGATLQEGPTTPVSPVQRDKTSGKVRRKPVTKKRGARKHRGRAVGEDNEDDEEEGLPGSARVAETKGLASHVLQQPPPSIKRPLLILVEDIDVVFEADRGFWTSLTRFIESSKRPIVMTCNDDPLHSQNPLLPASTTAVLESSTTAIPFYLPTMEESFLCIHVILLSNRIWMNPSLVKRLCSVGGGDLRRCLTELEAWLPSSKAAKIKSEAFKSCDEQGDSSANIRFALLGFGPNDAHPGELCWPQLATPSPDFAAELSAVMSLKEPVPSETALCEREGGTLRWASRQTRGVGDSEELQVMESLASLLDCRAFANTVLHIPDVLTFEIEEPDIYEMEDSPPHFGVFRAIAKTIPDSTRADGLAFHHILPTAALSGCLEALAGRVCRQKILGALDRAGFGDRSVSPVDVGWSIHGKASYDDAIR